MTSAVQKPIAVLLPNKKKRVWELDFLRGFAVLCMCFDHMMYDLAYARTWFSVRVENGVLDFLQRIAKAYWYSGSYGDLGFRFWAHYLFVFLFLFLVGVSCAFSRDNTKRGAQLGVVAIVFTGVTMVLRKFGIMSQGIVFGILDCIALSILCVALVDCLTAFNKKLNTIVPLVIGLFIIGLGIDKRFWTMGRPFDNTFSFDNLYMYILGTRGFGDDWFGIFPYLGAVFTGVYWGKTVYADRTSVLPRIDGKWNRPFRFVGRHALLFYLAHQVVMAAIVGIAYLIAGYRF